jgi:hypothetical protein
MIGPPETGVRIVTGVWRSAEYTPDSFFPPSSIMHQRDVVKHTGLWRDYRTLHTPPDHEFISRVYQYRQRFTTVDALTVFKFNSAWRPNSYREKPCHEQADYIRRIRTEPDFLNREFLAITRAYVLGKNHPPIKMAMPDPQTLPPGWLVEQWRKIRGLEPNALANAPQPKGTRSMYRRSKSALRRLFQSFPPRNGAGDKHG